MISELEDKPGLQETKVEATSLVTAWARPDMQSLLPHSIGQSSYRPTHIFKGNENNTLIPRICGYFKSITIVLLKARNVEVDN